MAVTPERALLLLFGFIGLLPASGLAAAPESRIGTGLRRLQRLGLIAELGRFGEQAVGVGKLALPRAP